MSAPAIPAPVDVSNAMVTGTVVKVMVVAAVNVRLVRVLVPPA